MIILYTFHKRSADSSFPHQTVLHLLALVETRGAKKVMEDYRSLYLRVSLGVRCERPRQEEGSIRSIIVTNIPFVPYYGT